MKLLQTTAGNACVSPLNIAHALGLVLLGTEKDTREQVVQALGHKTHEEAHAVLEKDRIRNFVANSRISKQSFSQHGIAFAELLSDKRPSKPSLKKISHQLPLDCLSKMDSN